MRCMRSRMLKKIYRTSNYPHRLKNGLFTMNTTILPMTHYSFMQRRPISPLCHHDCGEDDQCAHLKSPKGKRGNWKLFFAETSLILVWTTLSDKLSSGKKIQTSILSSSDPHTGLAFPLGRRDKHTQNQH